MFKLLHHAPGAAPRLAADEPLSPREFDDIAAMLGGAVRARKTGLIAARRAVAREHIDTHWNGQESHDDAAPGDWIATSLAADDLTPLRDSDGNLNQYVIRAARFAALYEAGRDHCEWGTICRSRTNVHAIYFPGGFEICAPWGEMQIAPAGWLLCNGTEVYGNNADTFAATYRIIPPGD